MSGIEEPLLALSGEEFDEPISFWGEFYELSMLSVPVALSTLCRLLIINTDTAFVGKLGKAELVAASFATTWSSFLSNIIWAPGYALNSICSQSIGAGNPKLAGVWLQLAIFVTTLLCIPVLAGYLATKPVVTLLVPIDNVPELALEFNIVSMLVLWPMVMYMCIRQYFQTLSVVTPAAVVSFLTVGFNFWMNLIFVPADGVFGWGLKGSPFATFLSMIFQIVCFSSYVIGYKKYHKDFWGGWTWAFLKPHRVKHFMNLVLPMAIGMIFENSGYQLITFATGRIGTEETREALIAANAILGSLWGVLWALYWGAGLALQVRVGQYLGKGSVYGAKLVAKISVVLVLLITSAVGCFAFALRTQIALLFTSDDDVIKIVEDAMYALVIDYFTACIALCAVNLLESMAQNQMLAFALGGGMWLVQVPFSLWFAYDVYAEHPVQGIWLGQVVGELFKIVILWAYLFRLDWEQMCKEAKERSEMEDTASTRGEGAEEDTMLENLLEESDPSFGSEAREIRIDNSRRSPRDATRLASSTSPFVGSKSPKFL